MNNIDYDKIDLNAAPPEDEVKKQQYYIAKCREWVKKKSEELGRPLVAATVTFGCQMNARDSEKIIGTLEEIGFQATEDENADFVIYNTCTVHASHYYDQDKYCDCHQWMHYLAKPHVVWPLDDVHAQTGGQARHGRVRTAEGSCHDTQGEECHSPLPQTPAGTQHGQQLVARRWLVNPLMVAEGIQENAKDKKEEIDRQIESPVHTHVQLALPQCPARQVLLHHILVKPGHHYYYENATHELFPEILPVRSIVQDEHPVHTAVPYDVVCSGKADIHLVADTCSNEHEGRKQHQRLDTVAPDDGLDSTLPGVEPYQQQNHGCGHGETYPVMVEYESLHYGTHQI